MALRQHVLYIFTDSGGCGGDLFLCNVYDDPVPDRIFKSCTADQRKDALEEQPAEMDFKCGS